MEKNFFVHDMMIPWEAELAELSEQLRLSPAEQQQLSRRVEQFPLASRILLQVLRHNESSTDANALLMESLAYGVLQGGGEFRCWLQQHPISRPCLPSPRQEVPVLLSRNNNVLAITLNDPEAHNSYSAMMRDALHEALVLLDMDSTIARCVIRAAGECFCAGGDLTEFGSITDLAKAHAIRMERNVAALLLKNAPRIECRVHRACIGSGIELPACAGRLVATGNTFFHLPELSMGLIPGAGGTVGILRRIGRHRLAWWILSGKRINAQTALEWGLIDDIYPRTGLGE